MKRRIFALLLAACLAGAPAVPAYAADSAGALRTVRALGILNGDERGNLNLSKNVTRAELVTMLTNASAYRDTVSRGGSGFSLFKDVKSGHWASEYIRLALQQGWMVGYTDGTFRPDRNVTLEEACSALLKLLGYGADSLAGSYPSAQLSKAAGLGLRDGLSAKQGQALTRQDCVTLFFNLLTAQTSGGQPYAATLGYTVTDGEVDYTSVVKDNLSGPYVARRGDALPFKPSTVYRDGDLSSSYTLSQNDVYYYNEGLETAWIYTERVSGKITELSPRDSAPTSVTVSGRTCSIGSADAAYQLSALGGGAEGHMVTLLLGMDGAVVGLLTGEEVDAVYYGVVRSSVRSSDDKGGASVQTEVTMICTDGAERVFAADKNVDYPAGRLAVATVSGGSVNVNGLGSRSTSGLVSGDGTKLGSLTLADGVEILDSSSAGAAVSIDPERLAGYALKDTDVRYYALNAAGEITCLILDDATGDIWTYAYLTEMSGSVDSSVSYTFVTGGAARTASSPGAKYAVSSGGIGISYASDGSIKTMKRMNSAKLTTLGTLWSLADNRRLTLADEVQIYLKQEKEYLQTELSAVNTKDYTLTAWYDSSGSAGGLVRIIIAEPNT